MTTLGHVSQTNGRAEIGRANLYPIAKIDMTRNLA